MIIQHQLIAIRFDMDATVGLICTFQQFDRQRIFNIGLNRAFQRAGAVHRIEPAQLSHPAPPDVHLQMQVHGFEARFFRLADAGDVADIGSSKPWNTTTSSIRLIISGRKCSSHLPSPLLSPLRNSGASEPLDVACRYWKSSQSRYF